MKLIKFPCRWGQNKGAGGGKTKKNNWWKNPSSPWECLSPDQWRQTPFHLTLTIHGTKIYKNCFEIVYLFEMPIESLMRGWDIVPPLGWVIDGKNVASQEGHKFNCCNCWFQSAWQLNFRKTRTAHFLYPSFPDWSHSFRYGCRWGQRDSAAQQLTQDWLAVGRSQFESQPQHFKTGLKVHFRCFWTDRRVSRSIVR